MKPGNPLGSEAISIVKLQSTVLIPAGEISSDR